MKTLTKFDFLEIQNNVQSFWTEKEIYNRAKEKALGKKRFYFLDGPPYTSGKVHLGTAWNKSLKDMIIRFKRMDGFDAWDRAGYDMHGLPTEQATEKELGIHGTQEVIEFGVEKFIEKCRNLCLRNMESMNEDFKKLGVWMDFENAYQSITKEFMESEWWFIKQAFEKGRLYEGLRTTTWDIPNATAVAKHELEYEEIEDTAIFVKFPVTKKENEFLVIWTTTPWTIPFNLAVMINPDLEYCKVNVTQEGTSQYWWVAKDLIDSFLSKLKDTTFEIVQTVKGDELEGLSYTHPFAQDMGFDDLKKQHEKLHTVLLSKEYVDTSAGSGLVHCAPGCGPEDFEVGYRNGLPAFNTVNENGVFEKAGQFNGWVAKKDDDKFIQTMIDMGVLIHQHSYVHDYPHDWRSKEPVIFRTTKQWFLKIDDIKEQLIKENDGIHWVPKAAYNAFNSWLENIRDNSISKQRFWGTPLPIWRNVDDPQDIIVVGDAKELEELSGVAVDDLHIPSVDPIQITKDNKTYKRIPDVLDVWVDAGTTSWNCLDYPTKKQDFEELFPADFILEGKDQIRGWFNLLHVMSNIAFGKKAFKACYMHGFINDSQGRKMSKSLQNYITPNEVTEKYGSDVMRFYLIGAANPGLDMNYNFDDIDLRSRNLLVLWNVHKFLLDMQVTNEFTEEDVVEGHKHLDTEEKYMFSRLNSAVKKVTSALNDYRLNEVPFMIESLFLELSRTYIQLVRDKASNGSKQQKQTVFATLVQSLSTIIKMFAIVAPFVSEQMYHNLKTTGLEQFCEESVHFCSWPGVNDSLIDEGLEKNLAFAQKVITASLSAREKAKLGVRWPVQAIVLDVDDEQKAKVKQFESLILQQLNAKEIRFDTVPVSYEIKPNYNVLGKTFGSQTGDVLNFIKGKDDEIVAFLEQDKKEFTLGEFDLTADMFDLKVLPKEGTSSVLFEDGKLMITTQLSDELLAEGFMRELARRIQQLRKEMGLQRRDRISLVITSTNTDLLNRILVHKDELVQKVGADSLDESSPQETRELTIKGETFTIGASKL